MRRAFSSTEITWVAAMATARMVLVFAFRVLEARGTAELTSLHACVLARIRLTRTAAERGPVLSGACGQVMIFGRTWCSRRW